MQDIRTIGIVGGGQLGRSLTVAAKELGFDVVVVEPGTNSPAAQVGAKQISANLYDEEALLQLAEEADVITIEIEHFDTATLEKIRKAGTPVLAHPETVEMIHDKLKQKQFLQENDIAIGDFAEIISPKQAEELLAEYGGAMMLKGRMGAYNGLANVEVTNVKALQRALERFEDSPLYAERLVDFTCELAVMVAKDINGKTVAHPVTETIQERHICQYTITPARVSEKVAKKATQLATEVVKLLDGAGIYGIEMFALKNGEVLVNEIAPRVHNSGHYTMDGCLTDQFEQHIRAIAGLPLGSTELVDPAVCMINILGERDGETKLEGVAEALETGSKNTNVFIHYYGKSPTKIDRKMGHINVLGQNTNQVVITAKRARKAINV